MKRVPPDPYGDRLQVTRHSLVERLVNLEDRQRWQEFFDAYWRLIYGVARKAGLNDAEAQDVVQETVISVARNIARYERGAGSFKGWLLKTTRWRIIDQLRARATVIQKPKNAVDPEDEALDLDAAWESEWQDNLLSAGLERLKRKVPARHYQIFDCAVLKRWPAGQVATQLNVSLAQVYIVRHRLGGLLKKEIKALEERET